jgi:DNA mismatch repair protein MutS2
VDLLHPEPRLTLDAAALGQALTFAFATGGTGQSFDALLNRAKLAPTRFQPDCFARDLFLGDLVKRCLALRIGGRTRAFHRAQLEREIAAPPTDPAVIGVRHAVLAELVEKSELRGAAERAWLAISELTGLLEAADRGKRFDAIGRRVEILRSVRAIFDQLATDFSGARSALSRLSAFGAKVRDGKGYANLAALLDHEGRLATIDLKVCVGYDGHLRGFEIVRADENRKNPFYVSPLRRLLSRVGMFFLGYRFREAEILGQLANGVFDGVQREVVELFQIGLHLEFYLAGLCFRDLALEKGLDVCLPEFDADSGNGSAEGRGTVLSALFNPLLLLETGAPRPCDLTVQKTAFVIITGPNSGGKTRLLQALGLSQLLGQAGLFVPAARARLVHREGLFVSLNQEPAADQPEGHLGMELLRIRKLFEQLDYNSLVIMDELCSGTNPSEGEEIFQLVVSLLAELAPQAFITTHFLQFAARLSQERPLRGLEFLQVELDENQESTYAFVPGVAPTSFAGKTAERLGVTRDALLGLVEEKKRRHGPPREAPAGTAPKSAARAAAAAKPSS